MSCDTFVTVLARGVDLDSFTTDFWKAMFYHDSVREKKYTEWRKEHTDPECVWADYLHDFPIEELKDLSKKYPELKIVTYDDTTGESQGKASFYRGHAFDVEDIYYPDCPDEDDFDDEDEFTNAEDEWVNFESEELEDWNDWSKFDTYEFNE